MKSIFYFFQNINNNLDIKNKNKENLKWEMHVLIIHVIVL